MIPFLQRLAETSADPQTALIAWLHLRGGAELEENAQRFLGYQDHRSRLDKLVATLVYSSVMTRNRVERRIYLRPVAEWRLGLRRMASGPGAPGGVQGLHFEDGLAEAIAECGLRSAELGRPIDPPCLAVNARGGPEPGRANMGGGTLPLAASGGNGSPPGVAECRDRSRSESTRERNLLISSSRIDLEGTATGGDRAWILAKLKRMPRLEAEVLRPQGGQQERISRLFWEFERNDRAWLCGVVGDLADQQGNHAAMFNTYATNRIRLADVSRKGAEAQRVVA